MARAINNKGLSQIGLLWDQGQLCWKETPELVEQFNLNVNKTILGGRLLDCLKMVQGPAGDPILDWTAWHWPKDRIFKAPKTSQVYNTLKQNDGWFTPLNIIWRTDWSEAKWTRCVDQLWTSKGPASMKCFMWKVLWGAIPTGNKISARELARIYARGVGVQ